MRRETLVVLALPLVQGCAVLAGVDGYAPTQQQQPQPPAAPPPDPTKVPSHPACARSCKGLLEVDPKAPSGFHPLSFGTSECRPMLCDMDTAGGGWTLVGRSAGSAAPQNANAPPFGWSVTTGDATDMTMPFSIDVVGAISAGLVVNEVMVTSFTDAVQRPDAVFTFSVPAGGFPGGAYAKSAVPTDNVTEVSGLCSGAAPAMLTYAGYGAADRRGFFLRNQTDDSTDTFFGLGAWGYSLWFGKNDCANTGGLDGEDGAIYVR